MIDVTAVRELYRYNRWANGRVFETISGLTQDEFVKGLGGSYPSVRDTLTHIVWAEWLWLQRWKGTSPQTVFQASDFARSDALRARWAEVEVEQRAFIEAVTAERLLSVVGYVNLQAQTW
ncbi:MAG: DinB family protein, partial [bacterium]